MLNIIKIGFLLLALLLSKVIFAASITISVAQNFLCLISFNNTTYHLVGNLTTGISNEEIVQASEGCNDINGYTVTISSQNGGVLKGVTDVPYSLKYNGVSVNGLQNGAVEVSNKNSSDYVSGIPISITVAGNANIPAGVYIDTLTLIINGK